MLRDWRVRLLTLVVHIKVIFGITFWETINVSFCVLNPIDFF
ncbi:Uncharacterised protein [Vibrio cholerae]|nr:Uncharacterised protein [Vibrio cholerae]CSI47533.1 Uncharacterised protein [Vibrio cholerae]